MIYLISLPNRVNTSVVQTYNDAKQGIPYKYTPEKGSIEELYKDIIVTLLNPYITEQLTRQYSEIIQNEVFQDETLQYDLFDIEFLEIQREHYRSFNFLVRLQIRPFVGAHNIIGIDEMIFRITSSGVDIKAFTHIESYY